jgi:hypothetical protein
VADAEGRVVGGLPGPGMATGGVYAVSLAGARSGHEAVAYFRARTGEPWVTNYLYGAPPPALAANGQPAPAATPLTLEVDDETNLPGR